MMEAGTYYGVPTAGVTGAAGTGTPQMVVTMNITHVANERGEWTPMENAIDRKVYIFLSDSAWDYSKPKLEALGFNGDFDNPAFTCEGVSMRCDHETYQGKTREKWEIDTGGGEVKKADTNTIRTLQAKWRSSAKPTAAAKPTGKPAAPSRKTAAVGAGPRDEDFDGGDDVPI